MRKPALILPVLLLIAAALTAGCGQKGELELPPRSQVIAGA